MATLSPKRSSARLESLRLDGPPCRLTYMFANFGPNSSTFLMAGVRAALIGDMVLFGPAIELRVSRRRHSPPACELLLMAYPPHAASLEPLQAHMASLRCGSTNAARHRLISLTSSVVQNFNQFCTLPSPGLCTVGASPQSEIGACCAALYCLNAKTPRPFPRTSLRRRLSHGHLCGYLRARQRHDIPLRPRDRRQGARGR